MNNKIPISEAIKYPAGTKFRLEELDERDAFADDHQLCGKECVLRYGEEFGFRSLVFLFDDDPRVLLYDANTTFTLLPKPDTSTTH